MSWRRSTQDACVPAACPQLLEWGGDLRAWETRQSGQAVGTPAKRRWDTACLLRAGGPSGHFCPVGVLWYWGLCGQFGFLTLREHLPEIKNHQASTDTPPPMAPLGRPPSQFPRLSSSLSGEAHPPGPVVRGTHLELRQPPSVELSRVLLSAQRLPCSLSRVLGGEQGT